MLSIVTTRRCTAACDHCCVGAGPRAQGAIPVERIHRLIDEAKRLDSIEHVTFTGGECFLLGSDLDALVRHASNAGYVTRAITNGYWAVNDRAAAARIGGLRIAGLNELMISTGTFHQRFVPVERIVRAARAAAEAGILTRVSVEECDQSVCDGSSIAAALTDLIAANKIYIGRDPWIADAGGRGTAMLSHDQILAEEPSRAKDACPQVYDVVTVTPTQQLTSCCGFPHEELPELHLGSLTAAGLDDVLQRTPHDIFKMWLHVSGPAGIADFVARYIPGYELPDSVSICQSCVALQRDPRAMDVVRRHGGVMAESITAEFDRIRQAAAPLANSLLHT